MLAWNNPGWISDVIKCKIWNNTTASPPVHISPALCGRFAGSETASPDSQSVRLSCQHQRHPWRRRQLPQLQTHHPSPARPRPLPAACCPVSSAGDLEAPPPAHHGYWALRRREQGPFEKWDSKADSLFIYFKGKSLKNGFGLLVADPTRQASWNMLVFSKVKAIKH